MQPIGQRAPIFHPEVRPFEVPAANFPSVTYPLRRPIRTGGGPSNSLPLAWILIQNRKRSDAAVVVRVRLIVRRDRLTAPPSPKADLSRQIPNELPFGNSGQSEGTVHRGVRGYSHK